jgi:hypothetical protein
MFSSVNDWIYEWAGDVTSKKYARARRFFVSASGNAALRQCVACVAIAQRTESNFEAGIALAQGTG